MTGRESLSASRLRTAFMAGFAASGEGFNGEYPFDGDVEHIDNALDGAFTEWAGKQAEEANDA